MAQDTPVVVAEGPLTKEGRISVDPTAGMLKGSVLHFRPLLVCYGVVKKELDRLLSHSLTAAGQGDQGS
jgi:hypothetical protein